MKFQRLVKAVLLTSILGVTQAAFAQDLILTAPPREKPEAGMKLYGPLAEHLTKLLGKKVVYEAPGNWLNYQRDMRSDKYDIVFDGPHFTSWRMVHLGHKVLVKLPGFLQFHLVTKKEFSDINKPEDLVAKKICSISPPNLSILSVLAAYQNPVQQPVLKGVKGGMGGVFKTFNSDNDCRAWSFRTAFYNKKLKEEDRAKMKIIYTTPKLPNQSISASKRLSDRDRSLIIQSLTLGDGIKASEPIVRRFGGKKAKAFIPAKQEEFQGHNLLLEGVIFGW